ncbi:MAG: hypothetical protein GX657_14060, partial [Chloroflexi bacterium]|nr:hypothetical protein [Chloroflexota bacterium]
MERADESRYLAYMLRLWSAGPGPEPAWRATTERVATGERRSFGSLGALFEYLVRETSCGGSGPAQTGASARGSEH